MSSKEIDAITERLSQASVEQSSILSFAGKGYKLDNAKDAQGIISEINACKSMKALRLDGNTLGVEAAKAIAKALEGHPEFERALWSDMFTGRLKTEIPDALRYLGSAIMLAGAKLVELDLSDNAFGPNGMKGLVDFLKSESCFSLQELRLHNNGLGVTGGKMLARSLLECHERSVKAQSPLRLRVFVSGRGRLEDEGSTALAEAFKAMGSLEEVQMPQNGINKAGIAALADAFTTNTNLRHINLNDNTFTRTGAYAMAKALPYLKKLEILNFGDCLVRTKGAIALAKSLCKIHNLKEVNLSFNEIRSEGGHHLADALSEQANLENFELGGNQLGDEGVELVRASLEAVEKLECLGSLSDDEGSEEEDNDSDSGGEQDEEEEPSDDVEGEEVNDPHLKVTGTAVTPKKQADVSGLVSSFLSFPSPTKLRELGPTGAKQIADSLGNEADDVEEVMKRYMRVCSVVIEQDNTARDTACQCADALFENLLRSKDENITATFTNSLLVHLGLLKSEDKKFKASSNVSGALLVLSHVVQQRYFPKHAREILQVFIGRPHAKLDTCPQSKAAVLQALYKF